MGGCPVLLKCYLAISHGLFNPGNHRILQHVLVNLPVGFDTLISGDKVFCPHDVTPAHTMMDASFGRWNDVYCSAGIFLMLLHKIRSFCGLQTVWTANNLLFHTIVGYVLSFKCGRNSRTFFQPFFSVGADKAVALFLCTENIWEP